MTAEKNPALKKVSPVLLFMAAAGLFFIATLAGTMSGADTARLNLWLALVLAWACNPARLAGKVLAAWGLCGAIAALAVLFWPARIAGSWLFALFMLAAGIFGRSNENSGSNSEKLIIFAAAFFNLSFITNTGHTDVQYDFASCFNYIEYILENNFLFWQENPLLARPSYSTYHPILHFWLAAAAMRAALLAGADMAQAAEAAQVLFCAYMMWFYLISARILRLFRLPPALRLGGLALICLFPAYNAIAGYFNNDCLLLPLQAGTIYYSLLYCRDGGRKNLWLTGFFATAAALTKLSGVLVLPMVAAALFLRWRRLGYDRQVFKELSLFALLLAAGVAVWPLYQHFRLGIGFGFVPPQAHLSLLPYSLWERFNPLGAFVYAQMFYNDFGINLWETMTKTALFGQWDFSMRGADIMPVIRGLAFLYKAILALVALGAAILGCRAVAGRRTDRQAAAQKNAITGDTAFIDTRTAYILTLLLAAGLLAGQIAFSLKHPYMCNQDFRYVAAITLPFALILTQFLQTLPRWCRIAGAALMWAFGMTAAVIWWRISF